MSHKITVGSTAPDFKLKDQHGNVVILNELLEKRKVVLFFYPKDQTSGCTAQVCSFRDSYEELLAKNVEVLGISSDGEKSHQAFSNKHKLQYSILSDPGGEIRKKYQVPNKLFFIPGRVTYLINQNGVIDLIHDAMTDARGHVRVVQEKLSE